MAGHEQQLLVGQSVELQFAGTDQPLRINAFVFGAPAREYLIAVPTMKIAPPGIAVGETAIVRFTSAIGLHECRTRVLRVSTAKMLNIAIERFERVVTLQRRKFFRVPACLAAHFQITASIAQERQGKEDPRALTHDVSAGGLRLETRLPLGLGDRLVLTVETPKGFRRALPPELGGDAWVVRLDETSRRNQKLYLAGVEFIFKSENQRDMWVRLTFDLQRGVQL